MLPLKDDQPRYSTPYVNYFFIALNLAIYFFQATLDQRSYIQFLRQFGVVPAHLSGLLSGSDRYTAAQVFLPFVTSMFVHGGWLHVVGNMWILYIFGDNVEDYVGHFKYIVFYLLSGLIAMLTQVATSPNSTFPCVGASGAIAGVLGAYFMLYPRARVLTWLFFIVVVYIPAWIWLGFWFVMQFFSGEEALSMARTGHDSGGVAFWAHVGGFIAGVVMIKLFRERPRRYPYAYS
ncbi:MAG TPA: rhomboid family intramembrane serine protease [Candidatus Sulfotelmatobacter sp.]|nr:rhomboid family intramembrane serine protease [Candidatus Sulfotelmatobacter sp.]